MKEFGELGKLRDDIYKKLSEKKDIKDVRRWVEIRKLLNSVGFFGSLKKSLVGVVEEGVIEDCDNWEIVGDGEVDLNLGVGKKIKIFVKHKDVGERWVRKGIDFKEYWLVVMGGVTKNNDLGYFIKGCMGEEVEAFEGEVVKGGKCCRVVDFGKMRNINLVRRIALGC
jgi:hypothetical protein